MSLFHQVKFDLTINFIFLFLNFFKNNSVFFSIFHLFQIKIPDFVWVLAIKNKFVTLGFTSFFFLLLLSSSLIFSSSAFFIIISSIFSKIKLSLVINWVLDFILKLDFSWFVISIIQLALFAELKFNFVVKKSLFFCVKVIRGFNKISSFDGIFENFKFISQYLTSQGL